MNPDGNNEVHLVHILSGQTPSIHEGSGARWMVYGDHVARVHDPAMTSFPTDMGFSLVRFLG